MPMRLIPLGTNGFIPTQGRQTMSFLVLAERDAILLDAGSGVSRLLDESLARLLRPYPILNIVLSHFHLDHTVGLTYLTIAAHGKPVHIYPPDRPLVQVSGEAALNELIRPPYFPLTLQRYPLPVAITPIRGDFQVGSLSVRVRAQEHDGGSIGIRIGDQIAYTTDTIVDPQNVEFVRGVSLLLHELWLDDAEKPAQDATKSGHSYASGVVRLATEAGVERLMIVHHHPLRSTAAIHKTAEAAQGATNVKIIVPEEGKVYDV